MTRRVLLTVLLVGVLACSIVAKPMVASKVVVALNCGSKDETVESYDKLFKYQGDQSFVSGKSIPVDYHSNDDAKDADILFTFDKRLYMYERHTYDEMTYTLPVKSGKNTIILKFAEMYFTQVGQRVFDIRIGGRIVRKDFDVIQKVGQKYAAHEQYIEIDIKSDGAYYQGEKLQGALSKASNKIRLSFAKGRQDNPIVQGIIVYHDSIENSPQQEFQYLRKTWDKQKQLQKAMKEDEKLKEKVAFQKKKERIVIRNDQIIVERSEPTGQGSGPKEKFGLIRKLLMGPLGIIGWSVAFGAAILLAYKHVFLMGSKESVEEHSS